MFKLKTYCLVAALSLLSCNLSSVNSNSLRNPTLSLKREEHVGSEYLDGEEKYKLSWNINEDEKTIYFEVSAETLGYVGFGLSPSGGMTGADILIAGVKDTGEEYSGDYHAKGPGTPEEDQNSDWVVTSLEETATHTNLKFHRLLNTCDGDDDIEITDGTMRLIYAMGATDDIAYHQANRGTKSVNFYLQDGNAFDSEKYEKVDMIVNNVMPTKHTSYWCTIHQAPLLTEKHHAVAFEAVIENPDALQHTHHFIMYRCIAPEGQDPDTLFGPWTVENHPGDHCSGGNVTDFPYSKYCSSYGTYIWSKGGKRLQFPENMGLPIPDTPGRREYYALEIHYDNPAVLDGKQFKTGARMYYTNDLRETEVGLLLIDHDIAPQLLVPPMVSDYIVAAHCSPACTEAFLPEDGITVFNNLFHAHLAGRKLKLRHFRGNEELSWVDVDEYYDFDFQQNKPLTTPRKIQKGDQLTVECTYDTTKHDGKAVIGGLSTHDEMCEAILYYYPRQDMFLCFSGQEINAHFNLLGMTDVKMKEESSVGSFPEFEIIKPDELAGDYLESVSFKVNWTQEFVEKLQQEKRYSEHIGSCRGSTGRAETGPVKYPQVPEYVPPNECEATTDPDATTPSDENPRSTAAGATAISSCSIFILVVIAFMSEKSLEN